MASVRFQARARWFYSPKPPIRSETGGALSPELKRPELETSHLSPSSAKVKKGEAIPSLFHKPSCNCA